MEDTVLGLLVWSKTIWAPNRLTSDIGPQLPAHLVIYKKDIRDKIQEVDRLAVKLRKKAKDQHDGKARKLEQLEQRTVVGVQHHLT